ncbi:hypothetical protein [Rhodococcus koreensis]
MIGDTHRRNSPGRGIALAVNGSGGDITGGRTGLPDLRISAHHAPGLRPHRADLATVWLHLDDRDRVQEQHHCARCQPHGHVLVISCSRCGDGSLLTGSPGEDLPPAILTWFEGHGWTTAPELVCDVHSRRLPT